MIDALRNVLPPEVELVAHRATGMILIECSWTSRDDWPEPPKRLLPIHILLTKGVVACLGAAHGEQWLQLCGRIVRSVTHRLKQYSPDPELPRGVPRDPFSIRITAADVGAHDGS